jgi:hypothetical protein
MQYVALSLDCLPSDLDKSTLELHTRNGLICGHGIMHYELRIARHRSDGRGSSRFPTMSLRNLSKLRRNYINHHRTIMYSTTGGQRIGEWVEQKLLRAVAMGFSLTIRVPVRSESDLVSD